mmetsp:Transcript_77533/g.207133  ORF Transcript_77533/g.207133 Transcript_77533/m.207133 type:complete len:212 (+) Transcript_77533:2256-2891(+)
MDLLVRKSCSHGQMIRLVAVLVNHLQEVPLTAIESDLRRGLGCLPIPITHRHRRRHLSQRVGPGLGGVLLGPVAEQVELRGLRSSEVKDVEPGLGGDEDPAEARPEVVIKPGRSLRQPGRVPPGPRRPRRICRILGRVGQIVGLRTEDPFPPLSQQPIGGILKRRLPPTGGGRGCSCARCGRRGCGRRCRCRGGRRRCGGRRGSCRRGVAL